MSGIGRTFTDCREFKDCDLPDEPYCWEVGALERTRPPTSSNQVKAIGIGLTKNDWMNRYIKVFMRSVFEISNETLTHLGIFSASQSPNPNPSFWDVHTLKIVGDYETLRQAVLAFISIRPLTRIVLDYLPELSVLQETTQIQSDSELLDSLQTLTIQETSQGKK